MGADRAKRDRLHVPAGRGGTARSAAATPAERLLQLQREAGNRAVGRLLTAQRQPAGTPENPPVTTLQPAGTMSPAQWSTAYRSAKAQPSVATYEPLFRDIAVTAGMDELGPGFVPNPIPVSDGKTAQPGLNLTLDETGNPGETAWIDNATKKFSVPLALSRTSPVDVSIGIILSPKALAEDKGVALPTARHEMVHARHHQQILAAIAGWRAVPARRRPDFDSWLDQQAKLKPTKTTKPMSALEVAVVKRGAKDGAADTEVLAYVEGFVNEFSRRPATADQAMLALTGLLGAVETTKLFTWRQADRVVQDEAMTRLSAYFATLDPVRQRLWREWLDRQQKNLSPKDDTGRRDFFGRLAAFVH